MLEHKAFALDLKAADGDTGEVEGYVAAFGGEDLDGDTIERGAFTKTVKEARGVFPGLWQHDLTQPIGVSTAMAEDDHGLKVEARFNMEVQRAREAFALLKQGAMKGFSVGFLPVKAVTKSAGGRGIREVRLFEWSAVTLPANPAAVVTDMKSADAFARAATLLDRELKAGRKISSANRTKIASALEVLKALLEETEPGEKSTQLPEGVREPATDLATLREWMARNF